MYHVYVYCNLYCWTEFVTLNAFLFFSHDAICTFCCALITGQMRGARSMHSSIFVPQIKKNGLGR